MIEQIKDFILSFLEAEQLFHQARLLEPDFEQYLMKRQLVDNFSTGIYLTSRYSRFESDSLLSRQEAETRLHSNFAPRLLLRIERYRLVDGRTIYAAYVTATDVWPGDAKPMVQADMRLLVENLESGWKIISRQRAPDFAFPTWGTTGGEDITLPDTPDEVVVYIPEENSA